MRTSITLVAVLLTMSVSGCGGGDSGSPATVAAVDSPADPPERLAAISAVSSLLGIPGHHLSLASATLSHDSSYASHRASNECPMSGSQQVVVPSELVVQSGGSVGPGSPQGGGGS